METPGVSAVQAMLRVQLVALLDASLKPLSHASSAPYKEDAADRVLTLSLRRALLVAAG
jgi:hypothetical protein